MTGTADDEDNGDSVLGTYHWNGDGQSPSLAIIDALAELEGVAPTSLDALYNSIEPEALDTVLRHDAADDVLVAFRRGDYLIAVRDDGEIQIRDADDPNK